MGRGIHYWNVRGCRSDVVLKGASRYESHCPGKRVCHFVEISHCVCAKEDIARENSTSKGLLPKQLRGNEALYWEQEFVKGEQSLADSIGTTKYVNKLKSLSEQP